MRKEKRTCERHKRIMTEDLIGHTGNVAKTEFVLIIDEKHCEYCLKYPKCLTCFQYEKTGKHYKDCPSV